MKKQTRKIQRMGGLLTEIREVLNDEEIDMAIIRIKRVTPKTDWKFLGLEEVQ